MSQERLLQSEMPENEPENKAPNARSSWASTKEDE